MTVQALVLDRFEALKEFAKTALAAGMAPKTVNRPEPLMMIIQAGIEVGLKPVQSLSSIAIIGGRATIYGDAALALVRASGLLQSILETVQEGVGYCTVHRKGESEPVTVQFSMADAAKAKLLDKPGPWKDYPDRMLQMRARSWALRDVFPDVLRGLILTEEACDIPIDQGNPVPLELDSTTHPAESKTRPALAAPAVALPEPPAAMAQLTEVPAATEPASPPPTSPAAMIEGVGPPMEIEASAESLLQDIGRLRTDWARKMGIQPDQIGAKWKRYLDARYRVSSAKDLNHGQMIDLIDHLQGVTLSKWEEDTPF